MFAHDVKLIQAIASFQDEQQLQLDIDSVTISFGVKCGTYTTTSVTQ